MGGRRLRAPPVSIGTKHLQLGCVSSGRRKAIERGPGTDAAVVPEGGERWSVMKRMAGGG